MGTKKKIRHVDEKHQDELALILLPSRKFVSSFLPTDAQRSEGGTELDSGFRFKIGNEVWEGMAHFTETKQLSEYSYVSRLMDMSPVG